MLAAWWVFLFVGSGLAIVLIEEAVIYRGDRDRRPRRRRR